jgi:hypothetical protein
MSDLDLIAKALAFVLGLGTVAFLLATIIWHEITDRKDK